MIYPPGQNVAKCPEVGGVLACSLPVFVAVGEANSVGGEELNQTVKLNSLFNNSFTAL